MADKKLSAFLAGTENTDPQADDRFYICDDPGGTPASEFIKFGTLLSCFSGVAHSTVQLIDGSTGATTTFTGTDDATRGTALTNAESAAAAGDLIVVGPGDYYGAGYGVDGVNYYFAPGSLVYNKEFGPSAPVFYLSGTAVGFNIFGHGTFKHIGDDSGGSPYNDANGRVFLLLTITGEFFIQAHEVSQETHDTSGAPSMLLQTGSYILDIDKVLSDEYDAVWGSGGATVRGRIGFLDSSGSNALESDGATVWGLNIDRVRCTGNAAADSESIRLLGTSSGWLNIGEISHTGDYSAIYAATTTNMQIRCSKVNTDSSSAPSIEVGAGTFECDYIVNADAAGVAAELHAGAKLAFQKIEGDVELNTDCNSAANCAYLSGHQIVPNGTNAITASGAAHVYLNSPIATTAAVGSHSNVTIHGGRLQTLGGPPEQGSTTGVTASTTQSQGQGAQTTESIVVATCANDDDVITLPGAYAGATVTVQNDGAYRLQIFPASGDYINNLAVDTSIKLQAGSSATFTSYDGEKWISANIYDNVVLTSGGIPKMSVHSDHLEYFIDGYPDSAGSYPWGASGYEWSAVWCYTLHNLQDMIQTEQSAAAESAAATFGQWWVKDDAPNRPVFQDDAGFNHPLSYMPVIAEPLTTRTLLSTDMNSMVRCTSGSAVTITIPPDSTTDFPIGAEFVIVQAGAGVVSLSAASPPALTGVTATAGQYTALTLKKIAADTWEAYGGDDDLSDIAALTPTDGNVIIGDGTNWTSAALTEADISDLGTYETADDDILKADTADVLSAGFGADAYDAGSKSTGTFTPDEANGNFQYATNDGDHTLAPPSNNCNIIIHYTNHDTTPGTITTSGFTLVDGDSIPTGTDEEFICYITKVNTVSHLCVKALQ